MEFKQSRKLSEVQYDLRGPVLQRAKQLEAEGHSILKLNIGNPAPFGFEAPDELIQDIIRNLPGSHGYGDSKGLPSARRAVAQSYQTRGLPIVDIEDVYIGNGVSELIAMSSTACSTTATRCSSRRPTTRCGPPRPRWPAARPCTTAATSRPTGPRTWPTSSRRSPTAPRRS
jgi:aspartate/methionine/tyrosine aminotransferase